MQIQTLDNIRHVRTGSFIPGGVLGSTPAEKGTVLGPNGKPITSDDINYILDSKRNPVTGEHYRLQGWNNGNIDQIVQGKEGAPTNGNSRKSYPILKKIIPLAASLIIALTGCRSPTDPPDPDPDPDGKVSIDFTVYNHTQGPLGTFTASSLDPGTWYKIDMNYITDRGINLSTVDPMRMAIRKDNFGDMIEKTTVGFVDILTPNAKASYDIFLFNNGNGANYQWMDDQGRKLKNGMANYVAYRHDMDGQTGPQRIWTDFSVPEIGGEPGILVQLSNAMDVPNVYKFGEIRTFTSPVNGAHMTYGFGDAEGEYGGHYSGAIIINRDLIKINKPSNEVVPFMIRIGLAEGFEIITISQDIGGKVSSATIQNNGVFLPIGQDFLLYNVIMN